MSEASGKAEAAAFPPQMTNAVQKLAQAQHVSLGLDGITALYLVLSLQLALSHPQNDGPSKQRMTVLAWALRDQLIERVPGIQPVIDAGWREIPGALRN